MTWTAMMAFAAICGVYTVSEFLSNKTKGYISSMVFASFIGLGLMWTGLVPKDVATTSTVLTMLYGIGIGLILVNLGTTIDLETLLGEWKTVVICCLGLVGLGLLAFTLGQMVFGREYALTAAPPISGGLIAYQIVAAAAEEAGRSDLAGYAALVMAFQGIIGMPVASFCLKKELSKEYAKGKFSNGPVPSSLPVKLPETKIFPDMKENSIMQFFKLSIGALIAYFLSKYVLTFINVNVMYLLVGILLKKVNFLTKNSLQSAGGYGLIIVGLYSMLFNGFAGVSPSGFVSMIVPIVGMLLLGAVGLAVGSVVMGKLVGYTPYMSIALGMTAMFGYPGTEILSNEVVDSMTEFTPEERESARGYVMPKMIVGGFTTVTIASVVFAGIIAPLIFK